MKKFFVLIVSLMVITIAYPAIAAEKVKLSPKGTLVSAVCDKAAQTATVTITGAEVTDFEFYAYEKTKHLGVKNEVTIDLWEGRRLNFHFKDGTQKCVNLLTPEMKDGHPIFGPGIGLDCSNPDGCCFIITCQ